MTIKLLVLDLDGTIALTQKYDDLNQQRQSSLILQKIKPGLSGEQLLASAFLPKFLSDCFKCGTDVIIITRAPKAYASTLLNILGIDYLECRSGNKISRAEKLRSLLISYKLDPSEMLYIGDEVGDMEAAREARCNFVFTDWTAGSPDITSEHRQNTDNSMFHQFKKDISSTLTVESANTNPYWKNGADWEEVCRVNEQKLALRPSGFQNVAKSTSDTFGEQGDEILFNRDFNTSEIFRPILNARFCTRFDYENHINIKRALMKILRLRFPRYRFEFSRNLDPAKTRFSAHVNYRSPLGDSLWKLCKHWLGENSGPEVHQHLIEFVALVMASHLVEEPVKPTLIPVPSSEFSMIQPAENSLRLAYRISELSGCPILPFLRKDKNKAITAITSTLDSKQTYLLIDDQITTGETMLKCKDYLERHFGINADFYAWSHSHADLQPAAIPARTSFGLKCQACGFVDEIHAPSCDERGVVNDNHLATKRKVIPERYLNVIKEYESLTGKSLTDTEKIQFSESQLVGQLSQNASKRRVESGIATRVSIENGKFKLDLVDWVNAMYDIEDPRAKAYGRRWLID